MFSACNCLEDVTDFGSVQTNVNIKLVVKATVDRYNARSSAFRWWFTHRGWDINGKRTTRNRSNSCKWKWTWTHNRHPREDPRALSSIPRVRAQPNRRQCGRPPCSYLSRAFTFVSRWESSIGSGHMAEHFRCRAWWPANETWSPSEFSIMIQDLYLI